MKHMMHVINIIQSERKYKLNMQLEIQSQLVVLRII